MAQSSRRPTVSSEEQDASIHIEMLVPYPAVLPAPVDVTLLVSMGTCTHIAYIHTYRYNKVLKATILKHS